MKLIILTPEQLFPDEGELVNYFLSDSITRIHLRKCSFGLWDYNNYLNKIDEKYHAKISVHGEIELLETFPSLGFHVKSDTRNDVAFMEKVKDKNPLVLSTSFHSWIEFEKSEAVYHYVFISPVFNSISKTNYHAAIDTSGLRDVKKQLAGQQKDCPAIIALGGVDVSKITMLHEWGFDGVAVLGAIWQAPEPKQAFDEIQSAISKLPNA